jgi:hypothetical protein
LPGQYINWAVLSPFLPAADAQKGDWPVMVNTPMNLADQANV